MRSIVLLCLLQGVCSDTAPIQNDVNPDATSFCADSDQAEDSDQVTLLQRATQQSQLMAPGDEAAMDKDWEDLTQDEQDAAAKLGFTQDNWNVDQPSEWPDSKWQNVSEEKRKALETLGYDQEAWDEDKENIKLDKQELIQESLPTEIEEESQQPPAHHLLLQAGHRRPLPSRSLPAPHYARCGFENADGCGIWLQEDRDDFSWQTRSGRTPTAGTGPGGAHEGSKYFYIEASSIRSRFVEQGQRRQRKGNIAVLRAITGKVTAGAYMEFWYHMFGSGIGALQVFARDSTDYISAGAFKYLKYQKKEVVASISELWKKSGDQTNKWHKARIDLSKYAGSAITLWFFGAVGDASNDKGDIAIDDVTLFSGGAKPNAPAPTPAPMNYKAVLLATSRSCGAKSKFVGRFMGRGGLETCAKTVAGFGGKYFQFGKSCKTGSCYVEWSSADNCPHGRGRKKGLYWSRMYNFYKIQAPAPAPAPTLAPTPAPLASQATTESPGAAVSAVYGRIDSDNSGIINRAEWNKALADGILRPGTGTTAAPSSASAKFARIDKDKTGIISKDEFNKAVANGIIKVPR